MSIGSPRRVGLIAAKLRPPDLPIGAIERQQVARRLDQTPVALVVAPPGFGKTTAVSLWAGAQASPVGWLSVDVLDAAPSTFWDHLLSALTSVVPTLDDPVTVLAGRPHGSSSLASLIAGVEASGRDGVLVLDDIGRLTDVTDLERLALLVDRLHDRLRFVITARADPALPLASWRSRGWVTDVREEHLRFEDDEAVALSQSVGATTIGSDAVARLNAHVGGWPMVLHLALLAIAEAQGGDDDVLDLIRGDRSLTDVVADAILGPLTPGERSVALDLSVLDQLDAVLARELVGAQRMRFVAALERRGALTAAAAPGARRFHPLVRELLEDELRWSDRARHARLHRRAAEVALDGGDLDAAHHHLTQAGDPDAADALLADPMLELADAGDLDGLTAFLRAAPRPAAVHHPLVAVDLALGWYAVGNGFEARRWYDRAARLASDGDATVEARLTMLRAALDHGHGHGLVAEARAALDRLRVLDEEGAVDRPLERRFPELAARICLWDGDVVAGRRWLERAGTVERPTTLALLATRALTAELDRLTGRLPRATRDAEAVLHDLAAWGPRPQPAHLDALLTAAACHGGAGALRRAERQADEALATAAVLGSDAGIARAGVLLSEIRLLWDGPAAAVAVLGDVRMRVAAAAPALGHQLATAESRAHLRADRPEVAAALLEDLPPTPRTQLVRAALAMAQGRLTDVAAALARSEHWTYPERLEAAVLVAACDATADGRARLAWLLQVGAATGWVAPFLGHGDRTERSLLALPLERLHPACAAHLRLGGWDGAGPTPPTLAVEALTGREQTILELLPTHLSYAQIADRLHLSVNTVKSNLKSIYRKLHVESRFAAVDAARSRNLV